MDTTTMKTATKPTGFPQTDAPQAFREMAEKGTRKPSKLMKK
jgi:hypothetical protein